MIRNSLKTPYLILSASILENSEKSKETSDNSNKYGNLFTVDKWERVKLIFEKDENGKNHPDYDYAIRSAGYGAAGGAAIGGILDSCIHVQRFLDRNDANLYLDKKHANRTAARQATLGFVKGVVKGGILLGVYVGGYMLFSSCLQAYRNKKGIIEYCFGGFGIGALLRFNYGLKGMFSGGLVGGTLGTFYGIFNWAKLKALGMSEDEYRQQQASLFDFREQWKQKEMMKRGFSENEKSKAGSS